MLDVDAKPERIKLDRFSRNILRVLGGRSLAIIEFSDELGPIIKYYYNRRSKFISKLLDNSAFVVELAIVGKHAKELILKDGTRVLLREFLIPINGRLGSNYIVVEISPNANTSILQAVFDELSRMISNYKKFDPSLINKILKKILLVKEKNKIDAYPHIRIS